MYLGQNGKLRPAAPKQKYFFVNWPSHRKQFDGQMVSNTMSCAYRSDQWCANPGISNPNLDLNPDTSNPNPPLFSWIRIQLLWIRIRIRIQLLREYIRFRFHTFVVLVEKLKLAVVWSDPEISNPDLNPNPPFFLESESGSLLSSSESESGSESSRKSSHITGSDDYLAGGGGGGRMPLTPTRWSGPHFLDMNRKF